MTYCGLTWDHPRGYDALAKAAEDANSARIEPLLEWHKQSLEGFESAPIGELCQQYDLLVLDHPHIGEAVAQDCLLPLDDVFSPDQISKWQSQSVGSSFASYVWNDKAWALPLDVATQVMARRQDKVAFAPSDWPDVLKLANRQPVALSLAGPHALLTLFSMVAGLGGSVGHVALLSDKPALQALAIMHQLYERRPSGSEALNPIGLLEAMAADDLDCVPLVFGYVNYAKRGRAGCITFSDTLGLDGTESGGVLGGTGIALSKRVVPSSALCEHIALLMTPATQRGLIPEFNGQPSAREAWLDDDVNSASGNFYKNCLATAEHALLRPRFDGYVKFQTVASARVRDALTSREPEEQTLSALRALWVQASNEPNSPYLHHQR